MATAGVSVTDRRGKEGGAGMTTDSKKCSMCRQIKPLSDFYRDWRNYSDGLRSWCKECYNAKSSAGVGWELFLPLNDKRWLRQLYHHEGLNLRDIAEMVGCRQGQVKQALQEHRIPLNRPHPARFIRLLRAVERQEAVAGKRTCS